MQVIVIIFEIRKHGVFFPTVPGKRLRVSHAVTFDL